MKTETKIAEENIARGKIWINEIKSREHKASCQRDIPRLKKIKENVVYVENELTHHLLDEIILDKENAIKKYEENGI